MSIDWTAYNNFNWNASQQHPMEQEERDTITRIAEREIQPAKLVGAVNWGIASPPGRYAATVIRVAPGINHRFVNKAVSLGVEHIALKVYKANEDARREFRKVMPLHNELLSRLPGLPSAHIQRTIRASWHVGQDGCQRGTLVQEWIPGQTLDTVLAGHSSMSPIDTHTARSILQQMFGEIIVPLWNRGLIWWDIRDANWCFDVKANRLSLIDIDALGAYAEEILAGTSWSRRDKGRVTALSRLRQTIWRVMQTQVVGSSSRTKSRLKETWDRLLEPQLKLLGRGVLSDAGASSAFMAFLDTTFAIARESAARAHTR